MEIVLGAHNLTNHTEFGRKIKPIKEIIIHKNWDAKALSYNNDIALIRLKEPVEFDRFIHPIAINSTLELKQFGKVVGWGAIDDYGTTADVAKIADLKTMEISDCLEKNRKLAIIFWKDSFCAVNVDQGVCVGDSGSGFYFDIDGKKYLKGIVSSSIIKKCSENEVALYTDITKYYDFIKVKNCLYIF